ncbi:NepR family anti-sigma factor [Sulfitobacter sp. LCG007]
MTSKKDEPSDRIASIIDANLKLVYSDLVQDDLPDRFKDLLAVLKAQDSEAKNSK